LLEAVERFAQAPYLHWFKTTYFDCFKKPEKKFAHGCPEIISRDVFLAFHGSPLRKSLHTRQKPSTVVMERGTYGGLGRFLSTFSSLHDFEQWPSKVCQTFLNKQARGEYPQAYHAAFLDLLPAPYRRAILRSQELFAQTGGKESMNYWRLDLADLDAGIAPIVASDLPRLYDKYARFYRKQQRIFHILKS
jgi:hypothetical protein